MIYAIYFALGFIAGGLVAWVKLSHEAEMYRPSGLFHVC